VKLVHRSVAAALLAPMLVLAVSAWGLIGLRCRMTGMVSFASCCPADGEPAPAPAQSSVGEPGCCERVVVETAKPAADAPTLAQRNEPEAQPVAYLPSGAPWMEPRPFRPDAGADPPRLSRPPLCLLKRSLLI
jgi:hypothetical protein